MNRMIRLAALVLAAAAPFAGASLRAQGVAAMAIKVEPRAVSEKDVVSGKTKLDPAKGYILVSGPERQFGVFLRVPDDATRVEWEKDRLKAFEKEQRRYKSSVQLWATDVATAKQTGSKPPERPIEPTLETFTFDPIELRGQVSFGPQFVYAKGETISYLQAVQPGTYIWYGSVLAVNGIPAGGSCVCMGTVRFEVKAGVVTDVGNWLIAAPHWNEDMDVTRLSLKQANEKRVAEGKNPRLPLALDEIKYGLPASLKDWPSVQAEFHASPKMNNYFGILISRLAPVPGVLAYHRDVVVDLRTGAEVDSPTLISRAKIKR
jgi:hypothetical protein